MNTRFQKLIAMFALVVLLASMVLVPNEVSAANDFYGDYTDVAKVYDYGSCPSIQGVAVGSQKMYAVKINGDDTQAFITMADKDTGETTKLYNADANSYYFNYFSHANDMDVWGIDGYSNLFVTTTEKGSNGIVRLKRDGNNLTKVANYRLQCDGEDICATAMAITGVSDGKIHFITKWVMQLYTGSVDVNATSATIQMEKFCSITKERVYIKGEYVNLSNYVNQGMGYYDGTLFVPISGDDNNLNRSVIMVFDLNNATKGSTVYPTEALVFRVTSGAYSALFELESCDICSGDKKLYFSVQRRKTNSDTDHDGIASFDDYTYSRLPVDAPTSDPNSSGSTTTTQTYTVRYNANGGTGTMADTTVTYGTSTALRANSFTRNGWDFAGWYAYRTSDSKWYYTNGSSYGWYAEGSQPSGYYKDTYGDGVSVAKTSNVNKDVVIMYAQWTAKDQTYTVRYNANGGSGTMADTIVVYGYGTPLRANTFTKTGYKFVGWNAYRTAKNQWYYTDGSTSGWYTEGSQPSGYTLEVYKDGASVAATTSVADDVAIFYAVWEPITYTVRYNANGGSGSMSDTTVTFGTSTALRTNSFTRSGYSFAGWYAYRTSDSKWYYTDGTNSAWYTEGSQPSGYYKSTYTNGVSVAKTSTVDGDVVIMYAQWTSTAPTTYTITFKNADGTVLQSSAVTAGTVPTAPANPTKVYDSSKHYTFKGWDKTLTAATADTTYTATYTATSHSYTSKVTQNATCAAEGSRTYTCSCGYSYIEKIASTGHSYSSKVTAATCTTSGYTTYTCSKCNDTYQDNIIASTGHNYKQTVIDATCTTGGYTTYLCTKCGDTYQSNSTTPSGHNYRSVVTAPTCNDQGYTTYTCQDCGNSYRGSYTNATGHSYSSVVTAPTCTDFGYTTYTCTRCSHQYKDNLVNPTGHSYKTTVVAPTCTSGGYTVYTCTCGNTYTSNQTQATGHSYVNGTCSTCGAQDPNGQPTVVTPTLTLKAPALEFKDMIKVVAFYTAENTQDVAEMGMLTYTEKVSVVDVNTAAYVLPGADYDASSGRYFSNSQGIHGKYLGDTVYLACYAKLTDGSYVYTKLAGYSPITYATNQLKNSTNTNLKQLCAAMLNYGAAAQMYFNHNTDNLANSSLTAEQIALPEAYNTGMVGTVPSANASKQGAFANNKGFSKRSPAVSFEGAFSINYFFTPAYTPANGITLYYWTEADFNAANVLAINNASGSINMVKDSNGQYRADIQDIAAKNLSNAVYVAAVYSDGTNTWTSGVLGYSIGSYCSSQATKGGTLADLAMATAVYGYHAKAYFG